MTTFLGPVGSLIPVKCASQLTSSSGREVSFTRTLGKQKAFLGRVTAREWSVDIGLAKLAELSALRWLAENTNTSMVWYPPDAVVGNILTPQQADFTPAAHDGLEGPLVEVGQGVWVKSGFPDENHWLNFPTISGPQYTVAVTPGRPVTVAAWFRGGSVGINVHWRDVNGDNLSADNGPRSRRDTLSRVSRTLTPPANAAQMRITLHGDQIAGPTVTLTDRLMPYAPGRGARSVIVHGMSDAVLRATEDQHLGSLSFTVSEVG